MTAPPGGQQGRIPDPSEYQTLNIDTGISPRPARISSGSSVLDEGAIEEYGRTYQHYRADTYQLPNDADEQGRLDMQHNICRLLMDGSLNWAPVENPRKVLDIATGTGIWSIEFAKEHPECSVFGSDLSLIQPKDIVPNCEFVREDADGEWTFDQDFDFIHARLFCVFSSDIKAVLRKAFDHLKPGGWIEFQETAYEHREAEGIMEGTALETALSYAMQTLIANHRNPYAMTVLRDLLHEVGFVDVVEKITPLPVDDWPVEEKFKEIGKWQLPNVLQGLESCTKLIMNAVKTKDEADAIVRAAQQEVLSREKNFYSLFYVVYGRKPT